jgi:hypothetical protein
MKHSANMVKQEMQEEKPVNESRSQERKFLKQMQEERAWVELMLCKI